MRRAGEDVVASEERARLREVLGNELVVVEEGTVVAAADRLPAGASYSELQLWKSKSQQLADTRLLADR